MILSEYTYLTNRKGVFNDQSFQIYFMRQNMNTEQFREEVNLVKEDQHFTLTERMKKLEEKRASWMTVSGRMEFSLFLNRVETMLGVGEIPEGATRAETEEHAKKLEEARNKLCAYLLLQHPNYMKQLQNQLANMKFYAETMRALQKEAEEESKLHEVFKQFTRMIVNEKICFDTGDMCMVLPGGSESLFTRNIREMGFSGLEDNDTVRKGIFKYWEACFLLQYVRTKESIPGDKQAKLDFELKRFGGSPREFRNHAEEEFKTYAGKFREALKKYRKYVGTSDVMSEIDTDPAFGRGDTDVIRRTLKDAYQALIEQLVQDQDSGAFPEDE